MRVPPSFVVGRFRCKHALSKVDRLAKPKPPSYSGHRTVSGGLTTSGATPGGLKHLSKVDSRDAQSWATEVWNRLGQGGARHAEAARRFRYRAGSRRDSTT